jgi:uncharacterized protein (TIGR03067 family)
MDGLRMSGLEGAWVPVAATVAGTTLEVSELRVRYLLLESGHYRIVDRSNRVVDTGDYRTGGETAQLDIIGRTGMGAGRTLRAIYELTGDALTVCYDLEGGERPGSMQAEAGQLLLRIAYTRAALGSSGATPA